MSWTFFVRVFSLFPRSLRSRFLRSFFSRADVLFSSLSSSLISLSYLSTPSLASPQVRSQHSPLRLSLPRCPLRKTLHLHPRPFPRSYRYPKHQEKDRAGGRQVVGSGSWRFLVPFSFDDRHSAFELVLPFHLVLFSRCVCL